MYDAIGTEGFERRFGNLFSALFSETQPRRASFRNVHWTFVLLTPDALGSRNSFEVLFRAISQVGDIEIVITSHDFLPVTDGPISSHVITLRTLRPFGMKKRAYLWLILKRYSVHPVIGRPS